MAEKTSQQIRQQDINNAAWAACDTFRGVMDGALYKDYILVMLFVKYISDIWKDRLEENADKYGKDESRIHQRMRYERFILPEGANFYDLYNNRNASNIGELINVAFDKIESENKKLKDVLCSTDFNSAANLGETKDRNRRLKTLLEDFNKPALDMRPSRVPEDIIGNTYIYLIERFDSDAGKKAGEFYTPQKVSELVAKLCAPMPGARICDPACGSGSLLLEASKAVGNNNFSLYGMESNLRTTALCRMNMFLHNADAANIFCCNTLTDPALTEVGSRLMKFDNIVANPPFSLDKWGAEEAQNDPYNRFWRGIPPKSKADYAFISHMLEAADAKHGRIAVVVPHGVLFRGSAEGRIRRKMIEDNQLDAVIGLPGNLFPTTSIPVAVLVFDRSREAGGENEKRKGVLFIDASRDYELGKNQNALLDSHVKKIICTYKARKAVEKYAYLATLEEIAANDFNLNIPRYVDTFEEEAEVNISEVQKEIDKLEDELAKVRRQMAAALKEMKK